jgi:alkylation response protein AidB-like acyl-CoA dehydrogenase
MQYIDHDFLRFLLFQVHDVEQLFQYDRFAHLDASAVDLVLSSAKDFADAEMYPYFRTLDEHFARWENNRVTTHPQIGKVLRACGENGWIGGGADFDLGGIQLPETVFGFIQTILQASNNAAQGYIGLTVGSSRLITSFGSKELIDTYIPNMFAGKWQGTMALTEPQAGSSLTDITTSAAPAGDGTYRIKGQKIFISGGDHSGAENFVHLTLARIDGAPAGVKGISLFVVPRMRPTADGGLEYNDVHTAGDFQKMGQRGYATTHLAYGENGDCHGWLVGEPNKGLPYMFQMMNEARIGVGQTAAAVAMAAYLHSLQYAKERPQGRLPGNRNPQAPPVLIIRHADVQRMLLSQQVIAEGSLCLSGECVILTDLHLASPDEKVRHESWLLLEILTPIIKAYATEQGIRAVNYGMQVLGGYGYTMDFPLQQYARDIRIMALYEGTTGIQSLDLLGRKVMMDNGAAFKLLLKAMQSTIAQAGQRAELKPYADTLQAEVKRLTDVTMHLTKFAAEGDAERFTADATVYMEMASLVVIGWQWLKMADAALEHRLTARFPEAFYESKVRCMQFFFRHELPHAAAHAQTLLDPAHVYAFSTAVAEV